METRKISDDRPSKDTQPVAPFGTSPDLAAQLKQTNYDGMLLKDRYLIEGELGRGGIGVVYLARDMQLLQRRVVIKVLLQDSEDSMHTPWFKKKFEQEIEALVRLDHPSIVGVLDAGVMPDGRLFFAMQFVEGATLRSLMKGESMSLARAAGIVRQIGAALSAAHDKGIVHRDLKPENIMVQTLSDGEERVKLIDFGIATVKDSQFSTSAERTKVAGALPYMAPEQLRGQPEIASDVWALGVIAYELVTGCLPFVADAMVQLHELQRKGLENKPSKFRGDLPAAAERAILKALSFDPRERFARAKDLGDELARTLIEPATHSRQFASGEQTTSLTPEMAHVLFMDLVGYSRLPMDQQPKLQRELREIVRGAKEYQRAHDSGEMISLPTGDGMALVFFRHPVAPVQCAVEIARALKDHPEIKLRMGVHSGPVYRVADINTNRNVAGGGINLAQRVMDCGDADHILVSHTVAVNIKDIGEWSQWLHDLGQQEVKHGAQVHIFNLYNNEIGNPQSPAKVQKEAEPAAVPSAPTKVGPTNELPPETAPAPKPAVIPGKLIAAIVVAVLAITAAIWYALLKDSASQRGGGQQSSPAPIAASGLLNYSLKVLAKGPDQKPVELPGEVIFTLGDELCYVFNSPQDGYLYIIGEGPDKVNGLPQYNFLFPNPDLVPANVPSLRANIPLFAPSERPPWFGVDNQKGTETHWLVCAERPVAELEKSLKRWWNNKDRGEIKDVNEIRLVQEFLNQTYSAAPPATNTGKHQTQLKGGKDGVLVYPVELKHR